MGFWNWHQKSVTGIFTAVIIAIGTTGHISQTSDGRLHWGPQPAHAQQRHTIPEAIRKAPDINLVTAWNVFHNDIGDPVDRTNGRERAAYILGGRRSNLGLAMDKQINPITAATSHEYLLLCSKMADGTSLGMANHNNLSFIHYGNGVENLFKGRQTKNLWAREHFAKGIFSAAELGPKDFQRLLRAGITIHYDNKATVEANAQNLAMHFLEAPLPQKELILNVGVWEKMKEIPVNHDVTDFRDPSYKLKSMYWNLGFLALTDDRIEKFNDRIGPKYHNKQGLYLKIYKKIKYHSYSENIIKTP